MYFFFFKQKTAYEMRISDWSSDVCSSDLIEYLGDQYQRNIQADQTRRIAGGDVGTDVFNRAAPGSTGYLSRAEGANTGTAVVGSPAITDPRGEGVGHIYTIEFTSGADYTVRIPAPHNNQDRKTAA